MSSLGLKHLKMWNQVCTIERCDEDTACLLAEYARNKASYYLKVANTSMNNPDFRIVADRLRILSGKESVCWALLEFRLNTGIHRDGKHYKSWLFDYGNRKTNANEQLYSLLSGVDLMVQMVVRDYCAGSIPQQERDQLHEVVSLDSTNEAGDSLTDYYLSQAERWLSPSPDQEVDSLLLEEKAGLLACEVLSELDDRWKVLLLVKYTEQSQPDSKIISLDHPALVEAAGCSKSQLYAARRGLNAFMSRKIGQMMGDIEPEMVAELKVRVATALIKLLFSWAESEKRCSVLLQYLDEKRGRIHEEE